LAPNKVPWRRCIYGNTSYRCRITQEAGKNGARILKNDAFNYANKKPRILAFGITYFIKDTAIRNGRADAEGLPNYENPAFAHEEPQTEHHQ
jgi:hypothetical protein